MDITQLFLPLLLAAAVSAQCEGPNPSNSNKKVVCYYASWSNKRPSPYSFTPNQIDPCICTHIIYAFGDIGNANTLVSYDPEFELNQRAYANITSLKRRNKDLKVMLGIGGWKDGTLKFGRITASETNRELFAENAVRFLRGYMFDGLDLNWQHPTFREGGSPEDRQNYVLLAQTLRNAFEEDAVSRNAPRLLLSIAISHQKKFLPGYDIVNFNNYMDFISVICYDYHFSFESAANHHSPLFSYEEYSEYNYDGENNINYTITLFSEQADPAKLVLGLPAYGRTYKLVDPKDTNFGSDADGPGDPGPVTGEKGWFAHFEICNFIKNENWKVVQTKPDAVGPYAFKGDQWVCFDDYDMIRRKASFAVQKGLAGIMFWAMDQDDFLGNCGDGKFPLIRSARDGLAEAMNEVDENINDPTPQSPSVTQPSFETRPTPTRETRPTPIRETRPTPTPETRPTPTRETRPPPSRQTSTSAPRPRPTQTNPVVFPSDMDTSMKDYDDSPVSNVPQPNVLDNLVQLIQGAGGMKNFLKLLREASNRVAPKRSNENTLVLDMVNLPPALIVLSNSSIYIKEIHYHSKT